VGGDAVWPFDFGEVDPRGTIEYEYDKLGRLSDLIDPGGLHLRYDPEGDLTEVERPNGVTTHSAYDDAGRLESTVSKLGEATLESLQYEYDPAGNRKAQVNRLVPGNDLRSRRAQPADRIQTRLEKAQQIPIRPRWQPHRSRSPRLRIQTPSISSPKPPTAPSMTTTKTAAWRKVQKGEEATAYEWNQFDNLAKVEGPRGSAEYSYDALGRLIERTDGASAKEIHYGDLSDLPSYDADSEGELTTGYVQGPAVCSRETGEASSFPLVDAYGDVVALTGKRQCLLAAELRSLGCSANRSKPRNGLGLVPSSAALTRSVA